jgi:REP element-mobilizing transposase RayT
MRDRKNTPLRDLRTYGCSRAPRLTECDYAGAEVIHLTNCAASGRPFATEVVAQMICADVEFYTRKMSYELYGYCLMPDHLHVPVSPGSSGVLVTKWLQVFKSHTGHEFVRLGGKAPLWQRSAYDHGCRKGETAEGVLAYIVNNPVRAGLADCWTDWRWTKVFIDL